MNHQISVSTRTTVIIPRGFSSRLQRALSNRRVTWMIYSKREHLLQEEYFTCPIWVMEFRSHEHICFLLTHSETGLKYLPPTDMRNSTQTDSQPKARRMRRISKEATQEGAACSPQRNDRAREVGLWSTPMTPPSQRCYKQGAPPQGGQGRGRRKRPRQLGELLFLLPQ